MSTWVAQGGQHRPPPKLSMLLKSSITQSLRGVRSVPDKSNFTPDEWKLLLESVMMASIAITAAEPHGLWGLLQESFAGGTELISSDHPVGL